MDYTGEFYWIAPEQVCALKSIWYLSLLRETYSPNPILEAVWSLGILALELAENPPYFDKLPKKVSSNGFFVFFLLMNE